MFGAVLKLTNDQTGRDALAVDFLQEPFLGPQVFTIPLARKRYVLGGDNIFRDGADLVASKRENAGVQIQTGFQECDFERLMDLKEKMERLCEQARLRSHRGWGPKVELQWRSEGKCYLRYADILDGDLDIPMNWLQMESPQHMVKPEDCILSLIRKPHWREDEETLENWVENPSFLLTQGGYVYEPAFGFDCWDSIGTATGGVDTINWIQGGQSAFIICPAGGGADVGIETDNIALVANTWYYVECWIWHRGGNRVTLRIERQTGPAWLTPVAQWTAVDTPVIDEQGKHVDAAWREPGFIRKGFVFQAPATDNYRVNIGVTAADDLGGDTQFDVDRVYLTEATNLNWTVVANRVLNPTTDWKEIYLMPRGWISGRKISSHFDRGDCEHFLEDQSLPVENHIHWLDIEDVPGNLEAESKIKFEIAFDEPGDIDKQLFARRTRDQPFHFQSNLNAPSAVLGVDTGLGDGPIAPGNSVPDCQALRTTFATQIGWRQRARWLLTGNALRNSFGAVRIYGILAHQATGAISVQLRLLQDTDAYQVYRLDGPQVILQTLAFVYDWWLIDLGLFHIPWFPGPLADVPDIQIQFWATRPAGVGILYCGGFFIMPVDEQFMISDLRPDAGLTIGDSWVTSSIQNIRGAMGYDTALQQLKGNFGYIGNPPFIVPDEQNRLFTVVTHNRGDAPASVFDEWRIFKEPFYVAVDYIPRFI